MPTRTWPPRREWRQSESRGFFKIWPVENAYEIVGGVVRSSPGAQIVSHYLPMARAADMRDELLRVARAPTNGVEDAVQRYVRRFGLLGYSSLYNPDLASRNYRRPKAISSGKYSGGDPFDWFRAQAEALRTVVELLDWLKLGRRRAAPHRQRADRNSRVDNSSSSSAMPGLATRSVARGQFIGVLLEPEFPNVLAVSARDARRAIEQACETVQELVHGNIGGVRRALRWKPVAEASEDERRVQSITNRPIAELGLTFGAAVDAVWWSMADVAVGSTTRQCDGCGSVFVQRHGSQRFCPGLSEREASPCANRLRQSNWRQRVKAKARAAVKRRAQRAAASAPSPRAEGARRKRAAHGSTPARR